MSMSLGQRLRTTLFGESHGPAVGALLEGVPAGTPVDFDFLVAELQRRRPGSGIASLRKETDECEILSGVYQGNATGGPILLLIRNRDVRSSDYGFLPDKPRPGHADLPSMINSSGAADLRGGGSNSARLTAGLVAAASLVKPLIDEYGISIRAHVSSIGSISTNIYPQEIPQVESCQRVRCCDLQVAEEMLKEVIRIKRSGDSIGSKVSVIIEGLPLGFGAPWFEGLEPLLAHALMSTPGARAVEFGSGIGASISLGSDHNSPWYLGEKGPTTDGDGALGGMATGAPLRISLTLKPPSSITKVQKTLNISSGMQEDLQVGGRHDPVLAPRAVPVVEALCRLVISDMILSRGDEDE